jgi:hypothetical protein
MFFVFLERKEKKQPFTLLFSTFLTIFRITMDMPLNEMTIKENRNGFNQREIYKISFDGQK